MRVGDDVEPAAGEVDRQPRHARALAIVDHADPLPARRIAHQSRQAAKPALSHSDG